MQKRTVAIMAVMGCAVAMLTGCGIKQEVFDAKVVELDTANQEIEALNGTIVDKDSLMENKKGELRTANAKLEEQVAEISKANAKAAETASELEIEKTKVSGLEGRLESAKSSATRARKATDEVDAELETLQEAYTVLNARWDQFEENLNTLDKTVGPAADAPMVAIEEDAGVEGKTAMEMLNDL